MAQHALPPGAARRRALFGLLDADGWSWAGLKASWWFLFIVFMLGYIPNLAYYVTVSNTVDIGYNFLSVVNWCPAQNEDLPCPAPAGTVLPWQTSPEELALPAPVSGASIFQSGAHLYLVGGETTSGPTEHVLTTDVTLDGNFGPWVPAPSLPEPRTDATLVAYLGVPYLIGGRDASGDPTRTVFAGTTEEGRLTGWQLSDGSNGTVDLTLPQPLAGAGAAVADIGLVVLGGDAGNGPVGDIYASRVDLTSQLGKWEEIAHLPLPAPRAHPAVVNIGDFLFVAGGEGPDGTATDSVYRLQFQNKEPIDDPDTGQPKGWAVAPDSQALPAPRSKGAGFTSNGALYVIGGVDQAGTPQASNLWTVPDTTTGNLPAWSMTAQTDLPEPRASSPIASVGSTVFLIGGEGSSGPLATSVRAGLSPAPPFFRLGLFGVTVPALSIKGEIGQQLGYAAAFGVGNVNFVILVLIGLAYSHPLRTKQVIAWLSRGRLKVPKPDEFEA